MPKGAKNVWTVDDRHEQRVSSIVLNLALELSTPVYSVRSGRNSASSLSSGFLAVFKTAYPSSSKPVIGSMIPVAFRRQ